MADGGGMVRAPASLRYKLTFASLIATVAALLTSGALFMFFLYKWGLDYIVADLRIKADVVSANSRAALAFGDPTYASESLAVFSGGNTTLMGDGGPQQVAVQYVTQRFFDVTRVPPFLGRGFVEGDDWPGAEPVIVLGYALWEQNFGKDPGEHGAGPSSESH